MWAGYQEQTHDYHDSAKKRSFLSHVDVFNLQKGRWEQQPTSGTPPLGVGGYACVAVDSDLHYFGGWCGHGNCRHNSVHKLSTSSFQWMMLAPTTTRGSGPMKKSHCGMVSFKDGEENFLFVVGGRGPTPSSHQLGAQYTQDTKFTCTNEQHMFSLNTGD